MEDAMILNKSSYERGFAHGLIYKNYSFEVNESKADQGSSKKSKFSMLHQVQKIQSKVEIPANLQIDGIPRIGATITKNMPIFAIYDTTKNSIKTVFHKENEPCRLDGVSLVLNDKNLNDIKVEYRVRF